MARWEPNARERLVRAAVDLFGEQGYEDTTVIQIAERAGLTKTTFFRHFPDKREVLFAGQGILSDQLAQGIASAPADASPLSAVAEGLVLAGAVFGEAQREFGPTLRTVIAANTELRERESFKRAGFVAAMTEALEKRGVPDPTATLAAELGGLAFHRTFERWVEPTNDRDFAELAREILRELNDKASTLD